METIVYLIRHSEKYRCVDSSKSSDSYQEKNEKQILSIKGEKKAYILSKNSEFDNVDVVISSNYARAIGTAKYIAGRNDKVINIMDGFGERVYGINSINDVAEDFEKKQLIDENYKIGNGESKKEVINRIYNSLMEVIDNHKGEKICIVSHGTAILFLLSVWCDIDILNDIDGRMNIRILFDKKSIFEGKFASPEVFKLVFEEDKIIDIKNISISY